MTEQELQQIAARVIAVLRGEENDGPAPVATAAGDTATSPAVSDTTPATGGDFTEQKRNDGDDENAGPEEPTTAVVGGGSEQSEPQVLSEAERSKLSPTATASLQRAVERSEHSRVSQENRNADGRLNGQNFAEYMALESTEFSCWDLAAFRPFPRLSGFRRCLFQPCPSLEKRSKSQLA